MSGKGLLTKLTCELNAKVISLLLLALSALLTGGCHTTPQSPREKFLTHVPDRTNYLECYEVSIESMQAQTDKIFNFANLVTGGIRQSITNCQPCSELEERLSRMERANVPIHKYYDECIDKVRKVYNPKTDVILYFRYWTGENTESGLLVTRGGVIKNKFLDVTFYP